MKKYRNLTWKIIGFAVARLILLRLFIEKTFPFIPQSNYSNYSMLDDIYQADLHPSIWGWGNFDGNHYIGIAMRGYGGFEHPFFPLYPWLIKLFADFGVLPLYVAEGISFLSKVIALLVIIPLLKLDGKPKIVWFFMFILLLFPTSFFFSATYNDGLFFLFATITIYFARKKFWVLSILAACVATLTRLNGLVLGLFIVTEYVCGDNWKIYFKQFSWRKIWDSKIFLVVLIPLVFLAYVVYTHFYTGSWETIFTDMSLWGQDQIVTPFQVFWRYIKILVIYPNFTTAYFTALLELTSVIGYMYLMIKFFRRIRPSYWILFVISILLPALTGTFQGMPRYCLHLYPFFLMIALLLEKKSILIKAIYFTISTALLLLLATMFVHGYFIA